MDKIKIVVGDDHPMVLEGMRSMLAGIPFVKVTSLAQNAYQAIEHLKEILPEIVITDINIPEISGIELSSKIQKEYPKVKIIAMSTYNERSYVSQMVQAGASGYLLKSASKEEMEEAILTVSSGKLYMSLELDISREEIKKMPVLTTREREVLVLIVEGLTNPQIAERLFVSPHTVDSHRKNLLTKFEVNNTAGLIKWAAKNGLI